MISRDSTTDVPGTLWPKWLFWASEKTTALRVRRVTHNQRVKWRAFIISSFPLLKVHLLIVLVWLAVMSLALRIIGWYTPDNWKTYLDISRQKNRRCSRLRKPEKMCIPEKRGVQALLTVCGIVRYCYDANAGWADSSRDWRLQAHLGRCDIETQNFFTACLLGCRCSLRTSTKWKPWFCWLLRRQLMILCFFLS